MRWIFLSLLTINIALFSWVFFLEDTDKSADVSQHINKPDLKGVPTIKLIGEGRLEKRKNIPHNRIPLDRPSEAGRQAESMCTLIGPFEKLLQAEYFVEHMQALEIVSKLQEIEVPGGVGYWVYLSPEVSRKEALRRLHELQAKGIDSYVIPKGDLANGISFGMFSQKEHAEARLEEMIKKGYQAELKEVKRALKEVWVILQPVEARKLSEELWQKVNSGNFRLERRQNYCPTVASADNFH